MSATPGGERIGEPNPRPASTPAAGVSAAPATRAAQRAAATGYARPPSAPVAVQRPRAVPSAVAPAPAGEPPALRSAPPKIASAVLSGLTLGEGPDRLQIEGFGGSARRGPRAALARERDVLPELAEPPAPRKLTRQPAFIVSVALAAAAVITVILVFLLRTVFAPPAQVEGLSIADVGGSYHVTWQGPNVPYAAVRVTASTPPVDVSSQIKGGRELWLPKTGGIVPADSCFIVVELSRLEELKPGGSAAELAAVGAQKTCVSDAVRGDGG
ncbi:hypothetical protein [Mycetocola spongiae]|uniref:hypothetical protein n=1 Tax=Mycetocola spongiae TaxID=2859226 RepID=UPI001CF3FDFA|nr:hypothetical protein [Mycetocola spongiae]UCR89976.1 hypothetical protein KXZ72_04745 [Mycetocola spongiae]